MILTCGKCGTAVRVPALPASGTARCGQCGHTIPYGMVGRKKPEKNLMYFIVTSSFIHHLPAASDATLGRSTGSTIPVHDQRASREHAKLVWTGSGFRLHDQGSTAGTRVNGETLTSPQVLKDRDDITIADTVLTFRAVRDRKELDDSVRKQKQRASSTVTAAMVSVGRLAEQDRFEGSLESFIIPEVCQILMLGQRTGTLKVRGVDPEPDGDLFFQDGRLIHACMGEETGHDTALDLLTRREGHFTFHPEIPDITQTLEQTTDALLLEAMRSWAE